MQRIVRPPIAVLLLEAGTHNETQVIVHRDVPLVEEAVQIRPEKQAIIDQVGSASRVGLDVRCLENGERVLSGDGARALIGVSHENAERALSKSRENRDG